MKRNLSRRDFLKLGAMGALSLSGLAGIPFPPPVDEDSYPSGLVGRVAHPVSVSVYKEANDQSEILRQVYRDQIINIYYELTPPTGPAWNPLWYRVWGGYVHSKYIQRVKIRFNTPLSTVNETGQLCEVSVPYTLVYKYNAYVGWQDYHRLYYQTTHWAVGIDAGPDGGAWYKLRDELTKEEFFAPAAHVRPIPDGEISPLSPDVSPNEKRIVVSLDKQTLTAYEGDTIVFHTTVATGLPSYGPSPNGIPTDTPRGTFNVVSKMPSKHMGPGIPVADGDLPGVPWTMFFLTPPGNAFHGTYWHHNFGNMMSHGCVNMRTDEAKWLFRWCTPVFETPITDRSMWEQRGVGTQVIIE